MGKLKFIHSQMGAGKTAALLSTAFHLRQGGAGVLIMTSNDREEGQVTSRVGLKAKALNLDSGQAIAPQLPDLGGIDHILVDEVQFLTESQVEELADIVDSRDVDITCYGLRSDFTGHAFGGSAHLFAICDEVESLQVSARCWCSRIATHNGRTHEGVLVTSGEVVVLDTGGSTAYEPLCRSHWKEGRTRAAKEGR